ncbi:MAG: alpha/beta fold hydrolase [Pseudomonadota bacterium]|nr:alpha/beta fold hydrolase [Pseudomonadota bacterium]
MTSRTRNTRLLPGLALVFATLAGCAASPALYQPGPARLTAAPVTDFEDYRAEARAVVAANRVAVDGFSREQQVAWNLPFRSPAAEHCAPEQTTGLLMIHGLADSPFVFRDLARALSDQCVEVRAPLLQGHGTRPGDLTVASADVWRAQVAEHFQALANDVDHVLIGGFSLGGALATDYALSGQQPAPEGLITFAPAWQLNRLDRYLWLARLADLFADFVEEEPELNPVKYESFAINSGVQIGEVLKRVQTGLGNSDRQPLPLFLVATEADSVINLPYLTEQFQTRFRHPDSRMLVFRDTRDKWVPEQTDPRIQSLNSYRPDDFILEFSHQSLLIAPDNELYGIGAPLQRCLEPNNIALDACQQLGDGELWFSAWHDTERPVFTSRLTWNPWFDTTVEALAEFIDASR